VLVRAGLAMPDDTGAERRHVGLHRRGDGYRGGVKRGVLIALGVALLLLGLALVAGGAAVAALLGPSGAVFSSPAKISGSGVAIVADDVTVDAGSLPLPSGFGDLTFSVRSTTGAPIFVGAAPPAQIDRYLTGAPYDVVVDLGAGRQATTRKVPGTQQPQPPATQAFWGLSASGSPAVFSSVPAGSSLVLMNSDARSGVSAELTARLTVRNAWTAAWTAIGAGVLAVVLAIVCFWRARVARRRTAMSTAPAAVPTASADTVLPDVLPTAPVAALAAHGETLSADSSLEPSPQDVPRPEVVGVAVASLVDDTTVMAPVGAPTAVDETAVMPVSPPVGGDLVDVTPESDEPPAQSGSETLAALVAEASLEGTTSDGGEAHDVVSTDPVTDPDPATDPVFAEIAERWGLLPAEGDRGIDDTSGVGDPGPG